MKEKLNFVYKACVEVMPQFRMDRYQVIELSNSFIFHGCLDERGELVLNRIFKKYNNGE